MILIDTSIWIDHFSNADLGLTRLLFTGHALSHPFVVGELALGRLRHRSAILKDLRDLPTALMASNDEVQILIEKNKLSGTGIGYVDAHLLAGTLLTTGAKLWTRDRRLRNAAIALDVDPKLDQ